MTRTLVAAISGWGKSYTAQTIMETNLPDQDYAIILDYKDEYRGLVKGGLAKHAIIGPNEQGLSVAQWEQVIKSEEKLVLSRHRLAPEEWREVADRAVQALRNLPGDKLAAIDEAHFVAPQRGAIPDAIKGLATTGRGEGVMSIWITQRLQELDETIIAQADERVLGGFDSEQDRNKLRPEYPKEVHKKGGKPVPSIPDEITAEGESISLRRFEDSDENTIGSEWIFWSDQGDLERWNTRNWDPETTHYGRQGNKMKYPGGAA